MNWYNNLLVAMKDSARWVFVERDENLEYIYKDSRTVLDKVTRLKFEVFSHSPSNYIYFDGKMVSSDEKFIKDFINMVECNKFNLTIKVLEQAYSGETKC